MIFQKFDLVVVNTLMQAEKVLLCLQHNIPHCFVIHENWSPEKINDIKSLWGIANLNKDIIKSALGKANSLIFPAKYLISTYQKYINPKKLKTIYCTIEENKIKTYQSTTNQNTEREKLNLPPDHLIFLQIGSITPRKGQLYTLKSFIHSRNNNLIPENSTLVLVGARNFRSGEREYLAEIHALIQLHQLSDFVRVYDVQENILQFIIASDIVIHPSTSEVLPIALLESGYCKKPIITSNMDGMPEFIQHKKSGFLINDPKSEEEISEAMHLLAMNKDLRATYGESVSNNIKKRHAPAIFTKAYLSEINKQLRLQVKS